MVSSGVADYRLRMRFLHGPGVMNVRAHVETNKTNERSIEQMHDQIAPFNDLRCCVHIAPGTPTRAGDDTRKTAVKQHYLSSELYVELSATQQILSDRTAASSGISLTTASSALPAYQVDSSPGNERQQGAAKVFFLCFSTPE